MSEFKPTHVSMNKDGKLSVGGVIEPAAAKKKKPYNPYARADEAYAKEIEEKKS